MQPEQSVTHRDYEQLVLNQPRSMPPQLMCVARLQGACAPFILQSTNKLAKHKAGKKGGCALVA